MVNDGNKEEMAGRNSASGAWKRTRGRVMVLEDVFEEVTIVELGEGRMRSLGIMRSTVRYSCSVL